MDHQESGGEYEVPCDIHGCQEACGFEPWEIPEPLGDTREPSLFSWDAVLQNDGCGSKKAGLALDFFLEREGNGRLAINLETRWPCGNYTRASRQLFEFDPVAYSSKTQPGEK